MKYLKLFENWLNEAEEGKSEVKPFDPKKPGETLVVDIDGNDFSIDDSKYTSRIIASMLGRCVKKDEKGTDPELTVIKMKIDEVTSQGQALSIMYVKEANVNVAHKIRMIIPNELSNLENTYVYYISKNASDDWVNDKGFISKQPKTFLVFDTGGIEEGFVLDREFTVVDWSNNKTNLVEPIKTTLGGICALATTNFDNLAVLKDANAGKPQSIAKALGYEIPDNYAPKQGVKFEDRP